MAAWIQGARNARRPVCHELTGRRSRVGQDGFMTKNVQDPGQYCPPAVETDPAKKNVGLQRGQGSVVKMSPSGVSSVRRR